MEYNNFIPRENNSQHIYKIRNTAHHTIMIKIEKIDTSVRTAEHESSRA